MLLYMVMTAGNILNLSRTGSKKENSNDLPVVLLVVLMNLSSCGTGMQGHVWSPLKRNDSLYSLGDRAQRSNVGSNHCLSV